MSFFQIAPTTIPQVTYDRTHYDELTPIKFQLLHLLKQNMVSSLPHGFPFQYGRDAHGRHSLSYASYEFQQALSSAEQRSRPEYVTFKYIAPFPKSSSRMEWRIMAPNRQSKRYANAPETMIAQVQVDPMVVQTRPFGLRLMTESRIIQEALAIALEIGILITIEVASPQTYMYPCRRNIQYNPGQIIFRTTDYLGRSEVVFVYQP
ncbi:hypothetical protein BJ912DRAFT_1041590 [Pholiota molesta]|nr:hypothetical protein BJ912DRAFT_1041590 [Pholiota molesta]